MIDGAGDLAGTLVAFGKVLKVSAKTCQVLTRINQAVQVGTAAYNFNQGAQMLAEGGHSWLEISAKTGEGFLHLLGARVKVCFPAGTQVAIGQSTDSDGRIQYQTAAIETLRPGDFVLAREEYGPAVKPQRIEEAFEFTSNHLVLITLADSSGGTQTVTTTEDHPFWISERHAYLKPADMLPGMTMVGPNEERQTVVDVERQVQAAWIPVYNLRVSEFHTYFVSQSSDKPPILVHNTDRKDCGEAAAAAAKAARNAPSKGSANPAVQKAAGRGSTLHSGKPGHLPEQLRERYPETEFEFTKPGVTGQDVKVVGGKHPSEYPGSTWPKGVDFGDFKPDTPGGLKTYLSDQKKKWFDPTNRLPYDPNSGELQ